MYVDTIRQDIHQCSVSCKSKKFNEQKKLKLWKPKYKSIAGHPINLAKSQIKSFECSKFI